MRAAVLHAARDLRIEEMPVPVPGPGELLIAVEVVGICGTDAAEYDHGPIQFRLPMVPGHEVSGRVVGVGAGVEGFAVGDLVASSGAGSCGGCARCRAGRPSMCPEYSAVGLHRNGGLAEQCVVPAASCLEVGSAGLGPEVAALAQPMSIAVHAMRRGAVAGGESVTVVGAGGIGVFLVHAAIAMGCSVTATDLDPDRLAIAGALGASTEGSGPSEVVFEVSGTESGMAAALDALAPGGRLVVVGFQKRPVRLDLASLTANQHELVGTNRIDTPIDLPAAVGLLAARLEGWADVAPVVIPLEEAGDRLQQMADGLRGPIKTLISPTAGAFRPAHRGIPGTGSG